jgi:succinate dehydrogenase hydrophobic anchor subunit
MKVDILFVKHQVFNGLQHQHQQKFQKIGTIVMMRLPLLKQMLHVVIGLYQLLDNFKIQDILVEFIGTTATMATGAVHRSIASTQSL